MVLLNHAASREVCVSEVVHIERLDSIVNIHIDALLVVANGKNNRN